MSIRGDRPGVVTDARAEASTAFRGAVCEALRRSGMPQKELADAVGTSYGDINRYLSTPEQLPREWLLVERILQCSGADADEFARAHGSFWGLVEAPHSKPGTAHDANVVVRPTEADANHAATALVIEEPPPAGASPGMETTSRKPRGPVPRPSTLDTWVPPTPPGRPARPGSALDAPWFPMPGGPWNAGFGPTNVDLPFSRRPTLVPAPRSPDSPQGSPDPVRSPKLDGSSPTHPPATVRWSRRTWLACGALSVLIAGAVTVAVVLLTSYGGPAPASVPAAPTSWTATVGAVEGPGLALRTAPSRSAATPVIGQLASGSSLAVECGLPGDPVTSPTGQTSATWLRTSAGAYVTAVYVDVAGPNPIPNCVAGQASLPLP
jgi:hypothetical protein